MAIAVLAAFAAAFADGEPTGIGWTDTLLRAGFASAVVLLSARARRWTWLVMAGGATLAADQAGLVALGVIALALAVVASRARRQSRPLGALVAALAVQVLLRLPDTDPALWTAFLAAVATGPAIISGYSALPGRARRRVRVGLAIAGVWAVITVLLLALSVLGAQDDVRSGVAHLRAAFTAAGEGDSDRAAVEFEAAAQDLEAADGSIGAWWAVPAQVMPGLGPQARALRSVSREGIALAASASAAATNADVDGLRLEDGALDLELVAELAAPSRLLPRPRRSWWRCRRRVCLPRRFGTEASLVQPVPSP